MGSSRVKGNVNYGGVLHILSGAPGSRNQGGRDKLAWEKLMKLEKEYFGQTRDGADVQRYRLTHPRGVSVALIEYGAIVQSVRAPDRDGQMDEISLGFGKLDGYLNEHPYFGATVGRYANRIAGGAFSLGGESYSVAINNGPNHFHGGLLGFDKALWDSDGSESDGECAVRFRHTSPDGEEGYPGRLEIVVTFVLDESNRLTISYEAACDSPTPVNLTNHTYWNLAGAGSGDIRGHELSIVADRYLPVDENLIPTGELAPGEGGPLDFRIPVAVGSRLDDVEGGYDHCFVLGEEASDAPRPAAILREPRSGRCLRISTTEPGLQLYTGNFLDGIAGSGGETFDLHGALCLEAQHFPDSPNRDDFPSTILQPGEVYRQVTVHEFSAA